MMDNLGAGFSPAGLTAAGFGSVADPILPVAVQFTTAARKIINKDFVPESISPVQEMVIWALSAVKGSTQIPSVGHTLQDIRVINPKTQQAINDAILAALAIPISNNFISVINIDVNPIPERDRVEIILNYVDLTTSKTINYKVL